MDSTSLDAMTRWLWHVVHVLVVGLTVFAIVQGATPRVLVAVIGIVMVAWYAAGALLAGHQPRRGVPWVLGLLTCWGGLLLMSPAASYLAFVWFVVEMHVLSGRWGLVAVAATWSAAVGRLVVHQGWSAGVVVGPLLGAVVAVTGVITVQLLGREAERRRVLLEELQDTREHLLAVERQAGQLEERERMAAEIHDTVAQGLTSVQLLLATAGRVLTTRPELAADYVEQAREATARNLAETRRLVAALAPTDLERASLHDALGRLAAQLTADGLPTKLVWGEVPELEVAREVVVLRVVQSATANVVQHARATTATITVNGTAEDGVVVEVGDDGCGFDPAAVAGDEHFGLALMRARVERAGGRFEVTSRPGRTVVRAEL